jgi:histidyl-tRNA synthetase
MKEIWNKLSSTTEYLFVNFEETMDQILKLYGKYLNKWKNIEIYPNSEKLKKQFKYADNKWIPNVIILWKDESEKWIYKIKNMQTWKEETINL